MLDEVWFVGSNPSKKNTDPTVPFDGTKSLLNLLSWMAVLGIKKYKFINISEEVGPYNLVKPTKDDCERLISTLKGKSHIVALGSIPSNILNKLSIENYRLPHPSPKNRLLNDPIFIEKELYKCRKYLDK